MGYDSITDSDFASTVALGMVLESKFTREPGEKYRKWFSLYSEYKFYDMEWINIPYFAWDPVETYLMKDGKDLYFSFFTPSEDSDDCKEGCKCEVSYSGKVLLSNLVADETYSVYDITNNKNLSSFTAASDTIKYDVLFAGCLFVKVSREH